MFRKILVCTDLSSASDALIRCVDEFEALGLEEAVLAYVIYVANTPGLEEMLAEAARPGLERQRKILTEQGVKVVVEMPFGKPARTLNDIAVNHDVSVILIGTRGESLAKGILLGSVVHRLLQLAEKPVLLIPIRILEGEGFSGTCDALCGDFFRHPLFATDFSDPAGKAFLYLEHIVAQTHPKETTLYHVQDEGRINPYLAHRLDEFNRIDQERLTALEERLKSRGAGKVHKEVEFGRPGPL
ncbi:MAG: universal stress protein, partial [Deltaproteobacteria bacterium]|nr:universal stress protein [Deltaproteobacteria bacterium]